MELIYIIILLVILLLLIFWNPKKPTKKTLANLIHKPTWMRLFLIDVGGVLLLSLIFWITRPVIYSLLSGYEHSLSHYSDCLESGNWNKLCRLPSYAPITSIIASILFPIELFFIFSLIQIKNIYPSLLQLLRVLLLSSIFMLTALSLLLKSVNPLLIISALAYIILLKLSLKPNPSKLSMLLISIILFILFVAASVSLSIFGISLHI
jgi:hypothetical protein